MSEVTAVALIDRAVRSNPTLVATFFKEHRPPIRARVTTQNVITYATKYPALAGRVRQLVGQGISFNCFLGLGKGSGQNQGNLWDSLTNTGEGLLGGLFGNIPNQLGNAVPGIDMVGHQPIVPMSPPQQRPFSPPPKKEETKILGMEPVTFSVLVVVFIIIILATVAFMNSKSN